MSLLDKVEGFIMTSKWIDTMGEGILATLSAPLGCSSAKQLPPISPEKQNETKPQESSPPEIPTSFGISCSDETQALLQKIYHGTTVSTGYETLNCADPVTESGQLFECPAIDDRAQLFTKYVPKVKLIRYYADQALFDSKFMSYPSNKDIIPLNDHFDFIPVGVDRVPDWACFGVSEPAIRSLVMAANGVDLSQSRIKITEDDVCYRTKPAKDAANGCISTIPTLHAIRDNFGIAVRGLFEKHQ